MSQNNDGKQADLSDNESDGGLSVNEAQRRIEALLSDDSEDTETSTAKPAKGKTPSNGEDDDDGYEPTADDVGEPEVEEDDEPEDPDEEDDEVDEEDEESEAPQTNAKKFKTKVDGEEVEVTLPEALAGYSRTASFTKKSQALAEEKRQHTAAVAAKEAELRASQEHYVSQLAALRSSLETPEPDWAAVQRDHPEEFANLHAAWRIHQDRIASVEAEQTREEQKLQQKYAAERIETIKSERAKLIEAIPLWGDATSKGKEFRQAIKEFGVAHGFAEQELVDTTDHRALKILHKAFLYDQSQAEKQKIREKGKGKIEALKAITPGSAPQGKRKPQTRVQAEKAQAKKSGSVRDAAKVLESMLG